MSCCPSAPPVSPSSDIIPLDGPEQDLRPGETVECFSMRAGNSTGRLDDTIEPRKNKIENESIPVDCQAKVDVQFKLTPPSDASPVSYAISGDATPGVSFTSAGKLSGTFDSSVHDKKLSVTIKASWPPASDGSTGDERTYTFSPTLCKGGDSIRFTMPLLGNASVKSPFGMRFHPIQKRDKLHNGIDLVMAKRGVNGDVVAAADGIVVKASNTDPRGYGLAIHVKHFNSTGKHLCSTVYAHMHQVFVKEGDKVSSGQKIGLEGGLKGDPNAGGSTGLHLHFGCQLPNGAWTDPVPYFKGDIPVATAQLPNTEPAPGPAPIVPSSGAAVTSSDVAAKTDCPKSEEYPLDPAKPEPAEEVAPSTAPPEQNPDGSPAPPTSVSPFEKAWFFTMKFEVGPHWAVQPGTEPTDPDIVAGKCDTAAEKKKCGYKMWANQSGGETKFGIAKSGNPRTDIKAINYKDTKNLGYSNYWKRGRINPSQLESQGAKHLAVFMFDTNFQHGDGNGRTIWADSAVGNGPWPDKASQMAALDRLYQRRLSFANSLKVVSNRAGVARRVQECYDYVKGITFA